MKNALVRMNMQLFLENVFASEISFECARIKPFVREIRTTWVQGIKRFTLVELQSGLKHLRQNKCVDSNGIVAECFVYGRLGCMSIHFVYLI